MPPTIPRPVIRLRRKAGDTWSISMTSIVGTIGVELPERLAARRSSLRVAALYARELHDLHVRRRNLLLYGYSFDVRRTI